MASKAQFFGSGNPDPDPDQGFWFYTGWGFISLEERGSVAMLSCWIARLVEMDGPS